MQEQNKPVDPNTQLGFYGNQKLGGTMIERMKMWHEEGFDLTPTIFDSTRFVLQYYERFHGVKLPDLSLITLPAMETVVRKRREYLEGLRGRSA